MNKYVRTKDGIYKLLEIDSHGVYYTDDLKHFYKSEITAESDKIEELCDRIFAFHKENKWGIPDMEGYTLESLKEEIKQNELDNSIDDFIFKFAIWTDKGLIYVAKMNSKGDLELL